MRTFGMCCVLAAAATLTSAGVARSAEKQIVTLTVEEEAGVVRANEPVTMGVPLPEGLVDDVRRLALRDAAGKDVPCQALEVARWLDGKSVKWAHLTWNQSVAAKGKSSVTVVLRDRQIAPPQTTLSAVKRGNVVTVKTGFVKFVVRGSKFNGFDAAWFDPTGGNNFGEANRVIGGRGGGSTVVSPAKAQVSVENEQFKVTGRGRAYRSVEDVEGKVEIEEQGPGRVVVKATGRHLSDGDKALDYIVRFYAYADSPIVRVSHTFVCAQGEKAGDHLFMKGLNLAVPTTLAGGEVNIGSEKAPVTVIGSARILQNTSDHYAITANGKTLAEGKGKSTKPITTGWLNLTKGGRGLAVGVKWFWQMFPKALSVTDNGAVHVELYPGDAGIQPLEVYMGQSRTHYLTFVFHDGRTDAAALNAIFAGSQRPLRAWAPGKYYCRDTHCFGYAVENDPALFGEDWPKVERWNDVMLKSVRLLLGVLDDNTYNGVRRDSYGIYAWGDRFHWGWPKFGKSPYKVRQWRESWAGNYYDYPNAMLMAFLRTGDKTFLERYFPNAIQIGDVHTCNYHPVKKRIGACRYCPPRNFVAVDNGSPYISNEFNHYKTQSVFTHWYLTGDLRSLDHCKMLANAAYENHDADSGWAARGIGAQMMGLWNAYELWRDTKYFDRMKGLAYRAMAQCRTGKYRKGGGFIEGILTEGLVHYYWVSGDPKVIETFKEGLPKTRAKTNYPNMSLSLALMYRMTGDRQWADWAWKALSRQKPSSRVHNPACQFRGTHFALYFLSDASTGWKPYTPADVGD